MLCVCAVTRRSGSADSKRWNKILGTSEEQIARNKHGSSKITKAKTVSNQETFYNDSTYENMHVVKRTSVEQATAMGMRERERE